MVREDPFQKYSDLQDESVNSEITVDKKSFRDFRSRYEKFHVCINLKKPHPRFRSFCSREAGRIPFKKLLNQTPILL